MPEMARNLGEHDVVVLTRDLPDQGLRAGDQRMVQGGLFFGGMGAVILGSTGVFWGVKAWRQGKYQTKQLPGRRKRTHGKTKDRADS